MARRVNYSGRLDKIFNRLDTSGFVRAMNRSIVQVRDYVRQRYMGGARTSPNRLARNTGSMERHTVATRAETAPNGDVKATVKVNVPYASVHFSDKGQKHTVIKPKVVKKLTVPILKNNQQRAPFPARAYKSRFAYNDILYTVRNRKFIIPVFALRSSVTVPSRIDIERDVAPFARTVFERELNEELKSFVK